MNVCLRHTCRALSNQICSPGRRSCPIQITCPVQKERCTTKEMGIRTKMQPRVQAHQIASRIREDQDQVQSPNTKETSPCPNQPSTPVVQVMSMMSMDPYSAQEESGQKYSTTPITSKVYNGRGRFFPFYQRYHERFQRSLFVGFSQYLNRGTRPRP